MQPRLGRLLAVVTVALALAAASASASERLELLPYEGTLGSVRASGTYTFTNEGGTVYTACPLTLTGSLHRTITKTRGALAGFINSVSVGSCTEGATLTTLSLPWHISYESFRGTLPNISSIRLKTNGVAMLVRLFGGLVGCLYRGDSYMDTDSGIAVRQLRIDETVNVPLFRNLTGICATNSRARATLAVSPAIGVTLGVCTPVELPTITFEAREGGSKEEVYRSGCNGYFIRDMYAVDDQMLINNNFTLEDRSRVRGTILNKNDPFTLTIGFRDRNPATYQGHVAILGNVLSTIPITYIDQP